MSKRAKASDGPTAGLPGWMQHMKWVESLLVTWLWGMSAIGCASVAEGDAAPASSEGAQSSEQDLRKNALTETQASAVLTLVDNICGDSWCEGDHNFHFDRIECTPACRSTPGTCRLRFRLFPYDSDLRQGPVYARSCETSGFYGFNSLVDTTENGYPSLNWEYYDQLSACIHEIEGKLP